MNISHDDFELTVVKETPNYNEPLIVKEEPINEAYSTTVESVSKVDFFHSTMIQTKFPHRQLSHSITSPCSTSASAFTTPKKQHISHNRSPLYSSVNSHVHKRRTSSASVNGAERGLEGYIYALKIDWEVSPSSVTSVSKIPVQHPFEKFAYVPPETNSSRWRTTKPKMRLPKKKSKFRLQNIVAYLICKF
ncbi:ATP-dependent helicase, C-terminal [Artemisia annua]|uniref:ATP-dependent helicase, C-terminal n=1 Tax=Artemisia annua TaxID=35608 RepID=A0A2U1NLS6_ARTAN|nr:ATP-dependent helicase, C-terminal [Artemisia annua]